MNHEQHNRPTDRADTTRFVPDTDQDITAGTSVSQPRVGHGEEFRDAPESLGTLVNDVITDVQTIVRNEVRLAQADLKEDVGTVAGAAAMGVAGALAGLVGLILLMAGLSLLLAQWLDDWLAFVIGGVVLFVLAGVLAMVAKNRVSAANLKPERTIDSLHEDKAWAQQQAQSLKEDQT